MKIHIGIACLVFVLQAQFGASQDQPPPANSAGSLRQMGRKAAFGRHIGNKYDSFAEWQNRRQGFSSRRWHKGDTFLCIG